MVVTSGRYRWTGEQCSFWGKGNIPYLDLWTWAAVYLVYVKVKLNGTKLASACQARGFQGSERVPRPSNSAVLALSLPPLPGDA